MSDLPKLVGEESKSWRIVVLFMIACGFGLSSAEAASIPRTQLHRIPAQPKSAQKSTTPFRALSPSSGDVPYHNGSTLLCFDCHSMHYSEQHAYDGAAGQGFPSLAGGPTKKLLRKGTAVDLCLACHDGRSGVPDVIDADVNSSTLRAAGQLASPEVSNPRGHTLSRNPGDDLCSRCHFVGSMATASVQCTDCHNKHGNGYYRNLQWASWPGGEPEIRAYIRPGSTGVARYEADSVRYPAPVDGSFREVTNICIDCHHTFFSPYYTNNDSGTPSPFKKHPGTNTESGWSSPVNRTGANTDPAHWVSGSGGGFTIPRLKFIVSGATSFDGAGVVAPSNEVFCLSCHQAHGSENAFALRWNYGSGQGATSQTGCQQCHNNVFNE